MVSPRNSLFDFSLSIPRDSRPTIHKLYKKQRLDVEDRDQVRNEENAQADRQDNIQAGNEGGDRAESEDEDADDDEDEDEGENKPPVIWSLGVYDAANTRHSGRERPYAIYESDKPIEITPGSKPKTSSYNGNCCPLPNQRYYPEFFYHTRTTAWSDVMAVQPLDNTSSLKFYEPWGFLLHRFLELKAHNDVPKMQSSQDDKDVDGSTKPSSGLSKSIYVILLSSWSPIITVVSFHAKKLWKSRTLGCLSICCVCVVISIQSTLARSLRDVNTLQKSEGWNLDMWYLDSDGQHISRTKIRYFIPAYTGTKALTSLGVCPATVWDTHDKGERRKKILERSKIVFESIQKGHLLAHYNGPIIGSNKHVGSLNNQYCIKKTNASTQYSGTIVLDQKRGMSNMHASPPDFLLIIDHSTQFEKYDFMKVNTTGMEDDDAASVASAQDSDDEEAKSTDAVFSAPLATKRAAAKIPYVSSLTSTLSEHQLLLLCPRTRAFALKTKQWLYLAVEIDPNSIQQLTRSAQSIENLVLGESELKTIKGLARRQNSKRATWAAGFVEGKGTGQIILLHGPPGVGKTYTVEAVAQYLHRPLVALTIADIGTVETRVERELITCFTMAEAWHAVLLVDEADIFLERRQNRDLARNGLVSAFLRRMEYFSGLLFLTTNRVGQIDDAFISRVHVAIGYNALSPDDRYKIWQGFFRKPAKERAGKIQISQGAKKWVLDKAKSGGAQLNGRDIRNALQTAITLAEAEHEEDPDFDDEKMPIVVDQSHFQRVLDITNKFQCYVESIKREDEKKRAANRFDRNDYYKSEVKREDREMPDF
ncbi:uncharacterized protein PG986_002553 [Apiospora aurea]|uniref:AAA+ ATPase domain-containing protein n=1 Tax=Apiospora aurea TaxID=335848 RepID=A0ABR1QP49_9PEZI